MSSEDLLDVDVFAKRLDRFIQSERRFVDGSLVIAIEAPFGSGKSFFLKRLGDLIEQDSRQVVVRINAWEDDYVSDPLSSIVCGMLAYLPENEPKKGALVEAAKDFSWLLLGLGNGFVSSASGLDPVAAVQFAQERKDGRTQKPLSSIVDFQAKRNSLIKLKSEVSSYISGLGKVVVFLIDELDRCHPDYAIQYLETIKHLFDVQSAVFVIAFDRVQLESIVAVRFGTRMEFKEYIRKFVHRSVRLPAVSKDGYARVVQNYIRRYFSKENGRKAALDWNDGIAENVVSLLHLHSLTLRQTQEVFRVAAYALSCNENDDRKVYFGLAIGTLLLSILRATRPNVYAKIGFNDLNVAELFEIIEKNVPAETSKWWTEFLIAGGVLGNNGTIQASELRTEAERRFRGGGISTEGWSQHWGHTNSNRIRQCAACLEEVTAWLRGSTD